LCEGKIGQLVEAEHERTLGLPFTVNSVSLANVSSRPPEVAGFPAPKLKGHHMLKNISVPVLVASLLAGSAVIAAGSAIAHDTKSLDAKAQATVDQPVALGNTDMSAAKKAAKKTKTKKGPTTKKET
jgi:hypothetical protein